MSSSQTAFTRRTLLKTAAAGAALTTAGRGPLAGPVAAQGDPVTLEFWNPATSPATTPIITSMVDTFNSTVGAKQGIVVNNRIKDNEPGYVPYTTAMTSSGSPDVVMTFDYDPVVSWAANGFIKPLDAYAEAVGIKEDDFFPIAWQMINFNGHTWGLLQEFDFDQLFWNTDIVDGEPPKTIDELDAVAKAHTKFDSAGNLTQAGFIPWMDPSGGQNWNTLWGGNFYDLDARKWTINTPENRRFLDWFMKYADMLGGRDKSDALESSVPREYGDIFQYGKVAYALEGEYLPGNLTAQGIKLNYKVAHAPTGPGVLYGAARTAGGNVFVLPSKAKHPDEAAVFIKYMGGLDAVLAWCVPSGNIPPIKSAAASPQFTGKWPILKPWLDSLDINHMEPPNPSPQKPVFNQLIGTAIDEVTYQKRPSDEALVDVAKGVADAVAQFQQSHPDWQGE